MRVKLPSNVPQTFQSAVSQVFQPASRPTFAPAADWKVGDTADKNVCGTSAFTMVEIAICLAVIGFALVAIIGVLPMGIQVQTDNRQESIINRDAAYFLDAIRKGAPPDDLRLYVEKISLTFTNANGAEYVHETNFFRDNHHIIGLLGNTNSVRTEAIVRSLSGAADEKGDYKNELAFKYKMTAIVRPLESLNPKLIFEPPGAVQPNTVYDWQKNLTHEVRLVFRYPLAFDGKTGAGKKVMRAMVGGRMNQHPDEPLEYFFYRHGLSPTNWLVTNNIFAP
jgi:type II secretory pathway pseudopilin PulG